MEKREARKVKIFRDKRKGTPSIAGLEEVVTT